MPNARVDVITRLSLLDCDASFPASWEAAYTEGGGYTEVVATGVTDQLMNMMGVASAKLVVVRSVDRTISIKIQSTVGTSFSMPAGSIWLATGASITAIYVSNSSGASATVQLVVVG